jgi:hypothetical protein
MRAIGTGYGSACLLLLAACGSGPDEGAQNILSIDVSDGDAKARLDALDAPQRDAVLLRAVRDAGQACQRVTGSAFQGFEFGMPSWVARCGDGRDWLIMIGKDGYAHVARREERPH